MDQKLLDAFRVLPADVREVASSPKTYDAIVSLEDRFGVPLADAIARVFAGLLRADQLEIFLQKNVGCDERKASAIASVVRSTILQQPTKPVTPPHSVPPHSSPPVSSGDEKDIEKHRERLSHISKGTQPTVSETIIDDLARRHAVQCSSPVLAKRFQSIVESRLRDVRSEDAVLELLVRSEKIGGMGIDATTAKHIVADLALLHAPVEPSTQPVQGVKPADRTLVPPKLPAALPKPPEPKHVPPPPAIERVVEPVKPTPPPPPRRPVVLEPGKRLMQDIQTPSQPLTPVDVLATITLDEFRNLGKNLAQSCAKIFEKVVLISDEAYEQRSEAISAWKRSPVHRLYVALGMESMDKEVSVEEIIEHRVRNGQPTMRLDEFTAIADLNRKLIP